MNNSGHALWPTTPSHARLELDIFLAQVQSLFCFAYGQKDFIGPERFGDIVVGALFHAFYGSVNTAVSTHHNHCATELLSLLLLEKRQAIHLRHADVTQNQ